MSLFGKKECAICGGKTGVISFRLAGKEKICTACEKMLRGKYDLVRQGAAFYDKLSELDLFRAKQIVGDMKNGQKSDISVLGNRYSNIARVLDVFTVSNLGLEEGGEQTVALGGRRAALCFCESGSFSRSDSVLILKEDGGKEASVLRLVPCTGAYPFEEYLIAGTHEKSFFENTNAWLVLDPDAVGIGDRIVKK